MVRIDARLVPQTRAGILDALDDRLDGRSRLVLLVDTFELLQPLEDWVRDELLLSLPDDALVVIAGRYPPGSRWLADPAWRDLLRVVSMRNLTPDDTRAYLAVEEIPPQLHDRIQVLSHGHPLTLSLLVDAVRRHGTAAVPTSLFNAPDLVGALLAQVVDAAPSPLHRSALETAAYARFTTEHLLRAVLDAGDATGEVFGWLRGLPFVEEGPCGLYPHDLVRDLLDADLRWRDRHSYVRLHRRIRAEVIAIAERAGEAERLHRVADLMFLARTHPPMARYFERFDMGVDRIDHVQPTDREPILAMTHLLQGPEQAELVEYWLQRQPDAFRVFRGPERAVAGYAGRLALHEATAADLDRDPGAQALWAYAQRHGAPRPGEQVLASRFFLDAQYEHGPSASLGLMTVWFVEEVVGQHRWAWDFVGTYEDECLWAPVMDYIGFGRAPEADYEIGGHRYRRVRPRLAARRIAGMAGPHRRPRTRSADRATTSAHAGGGPLAAGVRGRGPGCIARPARPLMRSSATRCCVPDSSASATVMVDAPDRPARPDRRGGRDSARRPSRAGSLRRRQPDLPALSPDPGAGRQDAAHVVQHLPPPPRPGRRPDHRVVVATRAARPPAFR